MKVKSSAGQQVDGNYDKFTARQFLHDEPPLSDSIKAFPRFGNSTFHFSNVWKTGASGSFSFVQGILWAILDHSILDYD